MDVENELLISSEDCLMMKTYLTPQGRITKEETEQEKAMNIPAKEYKALDTLEKKVNYIAKYLNIGD